MSRRYALIIGNSTYDDQSLSRLKTPEADAHALAIALRDPEVGGFDDVQEMINQSEANVRRAISTFFLKKKSDDQLLLYFSGHGVLDAQGRLFLAVKDTQRDLLNATAIAANFISDDMDACRSKRQILILDCCHSGAFAKGVKGDAPAVTASTFEGNGYGRVVLTASDSTQYALEGDQVIEQASLSLFTNYLLEGLKNGEADIAQDGLITLDEWYDYAYDRVVSETPDQTPRKWVYNQQGELIIAKNPNPKKSAPADLPEELKLAIESSFVTVRLQAVEELKRLLSGGNPALSLAANQALLKLAAQDDSKMIANAAAAALTAYDPLWHLREPIAPESTGEQAEAEQLAQEQAAQAEAERLAKEQAAQAEAERLAKEQAAQGEAERLAKEKAAQVEAERLAKEQAAQAEAQRFAKEQAAQAEAERLAKEQAAEAEAERLAKEKAAQAEAERLRRTREEAERQHRLEEDSRRQAEGQQEVTYLPFNGELRSTLVKPGETIELVIDVPTGDSKSLSVEFSDPQGRLVFTPPDAQITIQPGYNTVVRFRAALRQTPLVSITPAYAYQIRISASSGETQVLTGKVAAQARLPNWTLAAALGLIVLCLVVGGALYRNRIITAQREAAQFALEKGTLSAALVQLQESGATATNGLAIIQDTPTAETGAALPSDTPQAANTLPVVVEPTEIAPTHTLPPPPAFNQIAFASNRDGNWEIYTVNAVSGDIKRLTHDPRDDSFPVFSPNGRQILFHSDRNGNFDIFVMNADGSGLRQLTSDSRADTFASWSPDGDMIVFQSKRDGPKQIYVMNADGSGQTRLTRSAVDDQFPAWSPDGDWILYASLIDRVLQLFIIRSDGTDPLQLTIGNESYSFPVWSPDGNFIAAAYSTEDKDDIILGRFNWTDMTFTNVTGLTSSSSGKQTQPRWSADGKYVYYTANVVGNFDIFRVNPEDGYVEWLVVDQSDDEAPSASP